MVFQTLETLWLHICSTYTPVQIELYGSIVIQILTFWLPSTAFILFSSIFPGLSSRLKLQPHTRQPTGPEILNAARTAFSNFVLTTVIYGVVLNIQPSPFRFPTALPSLHELTGTFLIALPSRDIIFYGFHRLFHHPRLYVSLHKRHHDFTAPVAFAALHCTFAEQVLVNALPVILPCAVMNAHIVTFWAFLGVALLQATIDHAGFGAPLWRQAVRHDRHHELFNINFGTLGWMDWMLGTDEAGTARRRKGKGKSA
ncbi:hypothetical protein EDC01DRAFT_655719 [Geopyxis carbonaria]|nr:hypothetical protein EDC01DRAFT_655719 [Geopyxis carbonaria]